VPIKSRTTINTELTTAIGLKQDVLTSTNTIGAFNTATDFVVNGTKIELTKKTSNYVTRINTELTTAIGLKQDVLTSTNTIGVFNTSTDFVVNGTKIELTKNTSNYVARINTELTTSIGLKQDVLTTTNLFANKYNTTDFVVSSDKIRINKSLELGYYQINIFAPVKCTVSGGIRNNRVYYNNGDKIMFKNWGNGLVDVNTGNNAHLYMLYKIPATSVDEDTYDSMRTHILQY
jgi:hypothetical protein